MGEDAQAERERHDQEIAEANRERQVRQGHISEGDEEAKSAKPKAEPKKKSE